MLSFQQAEESVFNMVDFLNSQDGHIFIETLAKQWRTNFDPDYTISLSGVNQNDPRCMGCSDNKCMLGCYDGDRISLWDEALDSQLGEQLVTHEVGHAIHDQAFLTGLDPKSDFEDSERFAQWFEKRFTGSFFNRNSVHAMSTGSFLDGVINGVALGIGFAIASFAVKFLSKKK